MSEPQSDGGAVVEQESERLVWPFERTSPSISRLSSRTSDASVP